MPNRIIYGDRWVNSQKLSEVSDFGERLYGRLHASADDFGRFHGSPLLILAHCFPRQVGMLGSEKVKEGRDELGRIGLLVIYTDGKDEFVQIINWKQRIRAKESKFPGPNDRHMTVICRSNAPVIVIEDRDRGSGIGDGADALDPAQAEPGNLRPPHPPAYVVSCPTCAEMLRTLNDLTAKCYTAPGRAGEWLHSAHAGRERSAVLNAIRQSVERVHRERKPPRYLAPACLFKPENWDTTVNDTGPKQLDVEAILGPRPKR